MRANVPPSRFICREGESGGGRVYIENYIRGGISSSEMHFVRLLLIEDAVLNLEDFVMSIMSLSKK